MRNLVEAFESLEFHPWHGKNFAKLTAVNREASIVWLKAHEGDPKDKVELLVNRLWLDKEKTKNFMIITELMICANSIAKEIK